ncbi:MAG: alpha-1,4-glucan--maltose-1-phosphate maltosyltransferase [Thermomicrobiales bacterium]
MTRPRPPSLITITVEVECGDRWFADHRGSDALSGLENLSNTTDPPSSILIEHVYPELDCGRYPVKREVGDTLEVAADIFKEGHDKVAAVLRYRRVDDAVWSDVEMCLIDNDRWSASFPLTKNTRYVYTVEAFPDLFETWRDELTKKIGAGLDVSLELIEGDRIAAESCDRSAGDAPAFSDLLARARSATSQADAVAIMLSDELADLVRRHRSRAGAVAHPRELEVVVDRVAARYAAWYELLPRSAGNVQGQSATFQDVIERVPAIAAMGFDVLYFLPIHPVGHTNRKGPNNTLVAGPDDPGVPYAIGNELGGHDAIDPSLGTLEDFHEVVRVARAHGMEIALDFAIQCSPDHPWAREHPDWFHIRPDGSIKYAENPPKKYEDIYPINFATPTWRELWAELKRIVLYWVDQGVRAFRVDNPHTKPTVFWEWLIREVQRDHPDVIFLSEAFTRPKVMKALAKAGFAQSYTYFTWRNFKREIIEYFTELTQTDVAEYLRGNLFANTHDILPYILQEGGRPAFKMRFALAATLSSVYGIYSGFELCENTAVPGKEEYLRSEKYEYKVWDWDRPGNIIDYVTHLNAIRREHVALQEYDNLRFYGADDDNILCYGKATIERDDIIVIVVNLDPFQAHETNIHLPIQEFGIGEGDQYRVTELVTRESFLWTGGTQYVRLDPHWEPALIYSIRPWTHIDFAEPCY